MVKAATIYGPMQGIRKVLYLVLKNLVLCAWIEISGSAEDRKKCLKFEVG
jgi:hypothetical protein